MSEKKAPEDAVMIDTTAAAKEAKPEEKKEEVYDPFFGNPQSTSHILFRVQEGHGPT
jgi:hypothetical protein